MTGVQTCALPICFLQGVNKALEKAVPLKNKDQDIKILVKADKKIFSLSMEDILYVEGCGDYIKIRIPGRFIIVHDTIKDFLDKLTEDDFLRVHKSYAVNIKHIEFLDGNRIHIETATIPVSPSRRQELLEKMNGTG